MIHSKPHHRRPGPPCAGSRLLPVPDESQIATFNGARRKRALRADQAHAIGTTEPPVGAVTVTESNDCVTGRR
jgi:hypothetical protein